MISEPLVETAELHALKFYAEICGWEYHQFHEFSAVLSDRMQVERIKPLHDFSRPFEHGTFFVSGGTKYVVIRGTDSFADWAKNNFKIWKVSRHWYEGHAQRGFVQAAESMFNLLSPHEDQYLNKDEKHFPIVLMGHSLGGAIAVLLGQRLRSFYADSEVQPNISVFTFGAPRVGNSTWACSSSYRGDSNFDITQVRNQRDLVPRLFFSIPNIPVVGPLFEHFGAGYWHPYCTPVTLSKDTLDVGISAWEEHRANNIIPLGMRNLESLDRLWDIYRGIQNHHISIYIRNIEEAIQRQADQEALENSMPSDSDLSLD